MPSLALLIWHGKSTCVHVPRLADRDSFWRVYSFIRLEKFKAHMHGRSQAGDVDTDYGVCTVVQYPQHNVCTSVMLKELMMTRHLSPC